MNKEIRTLTVYNRKTKMLELVIEPHGEDYWLLPGEKVEVVVEITAPDFEFGVELYDENVVGVWLQRSFSHHVVLLGDQEIFCGHNRPLRNNIDD